MHAAVIDEPNAAPIYREYAEPVAYDDNEVVVEVLAAGLHHLTRAKANGTHYSSPGAFPLVPGVDAVVRDPSGALRYAALDDATLGTFAERTVIDVRRSVALPDGVDPVRIAAAMNPAMSSWIALRHRIPFMEGQRVLVLGATGNAGRMAIQIAKLCGASQVIAAGRDTTRLAGLPALGADETVTYDQMHLAADVDVVIDYVWGEPAAGAMIPMLTARGDRTVPLTWIQIGSMAGADAPVPSAALRSSRLEIVGSGMGSVPPRDIVAALPGLVEVLAEGAIDVQARSVPLAQISEVWTVETDDRMVFVP